MATPGNSSEVDHGNDPVWDFAEWSRLISSRTRYSGVEMTHRPDLFIHSRRVAFLALHLVELVEGLRFKYFTVDVRKIGRLAYFHDDPEIITDDIPAPIKAVMSDEEKKTLHENEQTATEKLAGIIFSPYATLEREEYIAQQEEIKNKQTIESQIVEVADKWDALGEKLHEVRCGRADIFLPMVDRSRKIFQGFDEYLFWKVVKDNPSLDFQNFLDDEKLAQLSKLTIGELKSRTDLEKALIGEMVEDWPALYRTWAKISWDNFDIKPEKFIFPGWYEELWRKWGLRPKKRLALRMVGSKPVFAEEIILEKTANENLGE